MRADWKPWHATQRAAWEALNRVGGHLMTSAARTIITTIVLSAGTGFVAGYLLGRGPGWVLWENIIQDAGFRTEVVPQTAGMRPMHTYNNKPDCDRALADALAAFKSSPVRVVTRDYQEAVVTMENRSTFTYRYACLPDTVDLRGSKGK
ncbi:MAG: hypothetical protein DME05_22125 [Candidatus Rokuibacteriota bacterium]|nr:MAG: hypothetical protein DME05_22125 [Candidatus Rokubacteria bacterium]